MREINLKENMASALELEKFHVYFLWEDGKIVYVGQSTKLFSRLEAHKKTKRFDSYSFVECENRIEMDLIESNLIIELQPKYNKTVKAGYESLNRFRKRVLNLGEYYCGNSEFYINRIKDILVDGGIELLDMKNRKMMRVEDVPKALDLILKVGES